MVNTHAISHSMDYHIPYSYIRTAGVMDHAPPYLVHQESMLRTTHVRRNRRHMTPPPHQSLSSIP
ncbi:hypothetical protein CVS40_0996 [Lucilia cuprina]|nr:hypothetical protein CVS40_0996 [Lucilia cuprina]